MALAGTSSTNGSADLGLAIIEGLAKKWSGKRFQGLEIIKT
jgi:hypothetical protein